MKKIDIINAVAEKTGFTQKDVNIIFNNIMGVIGDALQEEKAVGIRDFGCFSIKEYKERNCRNPFNGTIMKKPACKKVRFKPYKKITYYSSKFN